MPSRTKLVILNLLAAWDTRHCSLEMSAARSSLVSPCSLGHNSIFPSGKQNWSRSVVKSQPANCMSDTWGSDWRAHSPQQHWPGCLMAVGGLVSPKHYWYSSVLMMHKPAENVSSQYIASLKSIERNKTLNRLNCESCFILMLVTRSLQNRVVWHLFKFKHSEKKKNPKNPGCLWVVFFSGGEGVGCCFFYAGLMLEIAIIELRQLSPAIH